MNNTAGMQTARRHNCIELGKRPAALHSVGATAQGGFVGFVFSSIAEAWFMFILVSICAISRVCKERLDFRLALWSEQTGCV
jgi:hypothetical protein